ncbi:CGNR zinc finger domain-containing protein [Mycolicibacterium arenosum]|uniref:CGNR zinc finger domain-containing protein n=1 Tax=Mycolicibacterium arenosum TaxID=2952157 RepID=A0ABT1M8J0_9MYCO|nr:CGNR zinc finger domain-containing protein [Mycolicibacterium sp. CAU 1645]MCP9275137.1 CGNR zinc finger domain-containing protein [Mycolicibacterium sp. CAU 1645]
MTTTQPWLGDTEAKPAPEPLRRVQALINTVDWESGRDRLATADDAEPWLMDHDLLDSDAAVSGDDLHVLVEAREALRALVIQNTDGNAPAAAVTAPLRAIAADVALRASVGTDGRIGVAPVGSTVRDRIAGLLLVVQDAQRGGTWTHLKACANDECRWAFYDRSRNHGGTWCDMSSCGNRLKNRDFRARKRAHR